MTSDELRLLGLTLGSPLPTGGQRLSLEVKSGSGTASTWTYLFGPVLHRCFGVTMWPGSLNLWSEKPINWEQPLILRADSTEAEFCPVIMEESAIGLAFRQTPYTLEYLEVLASIELRPRLGALRDGQRVAVRLLSGSMLKPAA